MITQLEFGLCMLNTCPLLPRKHLCPTPTFAFLYQAVRKWALGLCNRGVHSLVAPAPSRASLLHPAPIRSCNCPFALWP